MEARCACLVTVPFMCVYCHDCLYVTPWAWSSMQAWNEAIGAMVMAPLQATARFVATLKSYASGTPTAHKLGGLLYADVSHTMEELVCVCVCYLFFSLACGGANCALAAHTLFLRKLRLLCASASWGVLCGWLCMLFRCLCPSLLCLGDG